MALGTLIFSQRVIHTKGRQAERIQKGKDSMCSGPSYADTKIPLSF